MRKPDAKGNVKFDFRGPAGLYRRLLREAERRGQPTDGRGRNRGASEIMREALDKYLEDPIPRQKISTDCLALADYLMSLPAPIRVKLCELAEGLRLVYAGREQGDDHIPGILGRVRNIFLPERRKGETPPGA